MTKPPPNEIKSLKDILWYLTYFGHLIPIYKDGIETRLVFLDAEDWAEKVSGWIERHELPAYLDLEHEVMIHEESNLNTNSRKD